MPVVENAALERSRTLVTGLWAPWCGRMAGAVLAPMAARQALYPTEVSTCTSSPTGLPGHRLHMRHDTISWNRENALAALCQSPGGTEGAAGTRRADVQASSFTVWYWRRTSRKMEQGSAPAREINPRDGGLGAPVCSGRGQRTAVHFGGSDLASWVLHW